MSRRSPRADRGPPSGPNGAACRETSPHCLVPGRWRQPPPRRPCSAAGARWRRAWATPSDRGRTRTPTHPAAPPCPARMIAPATGHSGAPRRSPARGDPRPDGSPTSPLRPALAMPSPRWSPPRHKTDLPPTTAPAKAPGRRRPNPIGTREDRGFDRPAGRLPASPGQLFLDPFAQALGGFRVGVLATVHIERRRRGQPQQPPLHAIFLDSGLDGGVFQILAKLGLIQPHVPGEPLQLRGRQAVLILPELLLKLPELPLPLGGHGSLSRQASVDMLGQGVVLEIHSNVALELVQDLTKHRLQPLAVRALVVRELDQDHLGVGAALAGGFLDVD